ncbi:Mbeg1-like protein [Fredinandcohnia salidurans]|uniref:Mbeg1-like protein n=1 Tax=Fredinandcohnia salidurans TaxID=2595041 RepID=A0ABW4MQP2_9BACI|nr:Mbeg1-like protein [Fredinandcohnia onubensis]
MSLTNLTEEEKNILLQLSYIDLPPNIDVSDHPNKTLTIEKFLSYVDPQVRKNQETRYKNIDEFLAKNPDSALHDIQLVQYQNNNPTENNNSVSGSQSGFVGYGFKDNDGNASAVFRGSEDMKDPVHFDTDWKSNIEAGIGYEIQQQREADAFYEKLTAGKDGQTLLLGHSKGGNLATYVYVNHLGDKVVAYVLNGAPIYWNNLTTEQKKALMGNRYTFVVYEGDIVSQTGVAPYVDKIVETIKDPSEYMAGEDRDFFYPHYETSAEFDENGYYKNYRDGTSIPRATANVVMLRLTELVDKFKLAYHIGKAMAEATIKVIVSIKKGIEALASYIKDQVINYVKKTIKAGIDLIKAVGDYFDNLAKDVASFVIKAIKKLGGYFPVEPYLKVNVARLYYYAQRLESIKRRVNALNNQIDSLYWEVDLLDIRHVLSADILTSFSYRLNQNINYLNTAARLLDANETKLVGKARIIQ